MKLQLKGLNLDKYSLRSYDFFTDSYSQSFAVYNIIADISDDDASKGRKKVNKLLIAVSVYSDCNWPVFVTGQSTTEPKLKSIKEQVSISEIEKQYNLC